MKKLTYILLLAAGAFIMACSSDDDFTAGTPAGVSDDGVFFYGDIDPQYIIGFNPTDEDTLWFTVLRSKKAEAIDVPLVFDKKPDVIKIADPIHFDENDSIDSLGITFAGLAEQQEAIIDFRIADEYANPYREKDGTTRLYTSIYHSRWDNVCDTLLMSSQQENFPNQGCMLQQLAGKNQFRITDFLGSGNSLEFNFSTGFDKENVVNSKGEINPTSNYYDTGGEYWYFTNGGIYQEWSPKGSDKVINWMEFYKGSAYTFLDLRCDPTTADTLVLNGKKYLCDYIYHYSTMAAWVNYQEPYTDKNGWDYLYFYACYLIKDEK